MSNTFINILLTFFKKYDIIYVQFENKGLILSTSKKKNLNGHYEEKTVFIIPWGLMICLTAFAVGPYFIGSGFLFLICPAQAASLLLIPAFKKVKAPVFIKDKPQPTTKISKAKEEETKLKKQEQGQAQIQETPKKQTFVEKIQAKQTTQNIKVA